MRNAVQVYYYYYIADIYYLGMCIVQWIMQLGDVPTPPVAATSTHLHRPKEAQLRGVICGRQPHTTTNHGRSMVSAVAAEVMTCQRSYIVAVSRLTSM